MIETRSSRDRAFLVSYHGPLRSLIRWVHVLGGGMNGQGRHLCLDRLEWGEQRDRPQTEKGTGDGLETIEGVADAIIMH